MKRTFVLAGFVAAAAMIGLGVGDASAQDGKALYEKECAKCHGASGAGDGATAAKMKDKPANWTAGGLKDYDDAKMAEIIKKGGKGVGKAPAMPAYGKLSDAEVNALVAHVKSMKK